MAVKSILFILFIFSVSTHAQFGTTYIGTEKKSDSMYKWTDHTGKTIYSDSLPPASCNTPSCNELLAKHREEQARKFPAPRTYVQTQQDLREAEKNAAKERRKKTHLLAGTIVCLSASHLETINTNYRALEVLKNRGECVELTTDIEYTAAGKALGFCECIRVFLTAARGNPSVWVRNFDVAYDVGR
jgi:hypothetical protein